MRRFFYILVIALCLAHVAQAQDDVRRNIAIKEVTVYGQRPMKDIGVQRTRIDSAVLKENVSLAMADVLAFNSSIFVKSYGRATLSTV